MPMSSPQMTTMFGLFDDCAIEISFRWSVVSKVLMGLHCSTARLSESQQHGKEGEEAYKDEDNGNSRDRCLLSLLGHPRDRGERFAPQVTKRPPVLPNRNEKRQDAARNQREPEVPRRLWKIGGAGPGKLLQMFEVLDNREAEADQCHGCSLPRHHCALKAQASADPAEMTVRRHPHFEPARSWSHVYIRHGQCPFCRFRLRDLTRGCAAPAARDARGRPANQDIREEREDKRDDQCLARVKRLKKNQLVDNVHYQPENNDPRRRVQSTVKPCPPFSRFAQ